MQAVSRCNPQVELKGGSNMVENCLPPLSHCHNIGSSSVLIHLQYSTTGMEVWQGCAFLSE